MKRALISSILPVLVGGYAWAADPCKLRLGHSPDFKPYQWEEKSTDGTLKQGGLDVELITAVVKNMKCDIVYQSSPWSRILTLIESGDLDLAGAASITDERKKFAFFSEPYRDESMVMFVKKGAAAKFPFKELNELVNFKFLLGVERGNWYGPTHDDLMKNNKKYAEHISEVRWLNQNVEMLTKDHIQGFLSDPITANVELKEKKLTDTVEIHPVKVHFNQVHVMLSKKSTKDATLAAFNKSLAELKANGEFAKILKNYL